MPSDRQARQQRHMAQVKQTPGSAQRGRKTTENVPGSGYRESQYIGGKKYYTPLSTDPNLSITGGSATTINVSGGMMGGLGTGVTVHADLSGLDTDDHDNYVHIGNQRTISAAHIFTANVVFSGEPQVADMSISSPVNIYTSLNHDNFAGFVTNEHIDWTNATANFLTTGTIGTGAATFTSVKSPTITTAASTALTISPTTSLLLIPGTGGMVFGEDGNQADLSSENFATGFTGGGWKMSSVADFQANNMTLRGTLSVYELLIQQVRATNGSIFVSSTGKVATVTSQTSITFEDPSNHGVTPFAVDDIILTQRVQLGGSSGTSNQIVKRVFAKVTALNGVTATLGAVSGAPTNVSTIEVGDDFVRIGNEGSNTASLARQGGIYLTADDSGAPFIDIFSGVSSYATWNSGNKIKARLGRLDGITDTDAGLAGSQTNYFGLYSDNVHLKGHLFSDSGNIGGWDISATAITSTVSSVDRLKLDSDGDIHIMSYTSGGSTRHGLFLYEHGGTSASDWWTIFHDDTSSNAGELVFNHEGTNVFQMLRNGSVEQPGNTEFLIENNITRLSHTSTMWHEIVDTNTSLGINSSLGGMRWYTTDTGTYGPAWNAAVSAKAGDAEGRLGLQFNYGGNTEPTNFYVNFKFDGDVTNGNDSANWDTSSDIRVKTDIESVSGAVNIISSLTPISYSFKEDYLLASHIKDKKRWGFSAQDFKSIIPEAVTTAPEYGYEDFHSINTDMLVPILVAAVKELKAEIDALKE